MRYQRIEVEKRIGDSDAAVALLAPALRDLAHETFAVLYLDDHCRMLRSAFLGGASCAMVEVPLRLLFHQALEVDARALIVAHNHPCGDARPSEADLAVTRRLVGIARPLGLRVLDHLIFARRDVASFRALGLL